VLRRNILNNRHGRKLCGECHFNRAEFKWPSRETYRYPLRCWSCRKRGARDYGPGRPGSREFPCEGHGWSRCPTCPRDPEQEVAPGLLSVEQLYRLRGYHGYPATFRKRDAIERFGRWAVSEAWRFGLRPWQAEEWAQALAGVTAREVWPEWDSCVEAEGAAGGSPPGGRPGASRLRG
jgi:hypothetical protein